MAKNTKLSQSDLEDLAPKLDQFVSSLNPSQQAALAEPFAAAAQGQQPPAAIQQFLDEKVGNLNPHTRSIVAGIAAGIASGRGTSAGIASGAAAGRGTSAGIAAGIASGRGTTAGIAAKKGGRGAAAGIAAQKASSKKGKKK